ncbi:MAG: Rossmann-like domain-containing protein [Anaerolineae bacterium]
MAVLDDLFANLPPDMPVRSILVGAHWTIVCSRRAGLAATLMDTWPHGHSRVADVGRLHKKTAHELIQFARSDNLLESSIGVATLNSLLEVDEAHLDELDAVEVLRRRGHGKRVALVGHFPFIRRLRPNVKELWVLEERPLPDEHPAAAAPDLIPQADVVAITATTLINGTLDRLLGLCRPEAFVMLLGPSTPLSPALLDYGVDVLSGTQVIDEEAAIRTIGQGAIFPQVAGVRRVTMARSE